MIDMKYNLDPKLVDEIVRFARACNLDRVILFGSRARGDNHERSDIDLAVFGGDARLFNRYVNECTRTLLKFDVIDLERDLDDEFRDSIEREGIVIHEKA